MTVYISNRDGDGKTNEEGHYRLLSKILQGQVATSGDLLVEQNSPVGMSVIVNPGDFRVQSTTYAYMGWIDNDEVITISTANPSNPRITSIVLYVDTLEDTAPSPANNPGIGKVIAIDGNASSTPSAPNNSAIQSVIGVSNPYIVLAEVYVGAGATQVTNPNITDRRELMRLIPGIIDNDAVEDNSISRNKIQDGEVVNSKLGASSVSPSKLAFESVTSSKINNTWIGSTAGALNVGTSWVNLFSKSFTIPEDAYIRVIWTAGGNQNVAGDPGAAILVNGNAVVSRTGASGLELYAASMNADFPFALAGRTSGPVAAGTVTVTCRAVHSAANGWDVTAGDVKIEAIDPSKVLV